jgi:hypothetical protein
MADQPKPFTYEATTKFILDLLGQAQKDISSSKTTPGVINSSVINHPVKAGYTPYDELPQIIKYNIDRNDILTLVREQYVDQGTIGTLWYNGSVIGVTLEDPIDGSGRGNKAISKGIYNISLDTTNNPSLTGNYVKFPSDGRTKFMNPGVFPRINGVPNQSGIRIHAGGNKSDSLGCVLFSKTRKPDHINIKYSLQDNHWLTNLIYSNGLYSDNPKQKHIIIINKWDHK